ncbi:MAG: SynChlorMet cassette protein ScmC [Candidatus Margulisiibacteriota bacterium]
MQNANKTSAGFCKPYYFALGDSTTFQLTAAKPLKKILAAFARDYNLSKPHRPAAHQVIILPWHKRKKLPAAILQQLNLPRTGWKTASHPTVTPAIRTWSHAKQDTVFFAIKNISPLDISWVLLHIFAHVIRAGGFPLHAAMLTKDKHAVLISAPGKTGKTTSCLKTRRPWKASCDDQVIVFKNNDHYFSYPLPTLTALPKKAIFQGKTCHPMRLSGIFFLEQATKDSVTPLPPSQAAVLLYQHMQFSSSGKSLFAVFRSRRQLEIKKLENASKLAQTIPCFILRAKLNGHFLQIIEKALRRHPTPASAAQVPLFIDYKPHN